MKKYFLSALAFLLISPQVFAGPFDVLHRNVPDFIVKDIWQETNSNYLYVNICNIWWAMDSSWDLTVWIRLNVRNWISKSISIENIRFNSKECNLYNIANASDFWINWNRTYSLAWAVKLENYTRFEANQNNNILIKDLFVRNYNTNSSTYYNTPQLYYNDTSYNYVPLNYGDNYSSSNYYNSTAWDLSISEVNYYDRKTVNYNWNSREAYNSIVAKICNYWNDLYYNGSVRAKIEMNWKTDNIYLNPFWTWRRWECREIWSSVNNFNIYNNATYWVAVTIDDTNLISDSNRSNNYLYKSIYITNYSNSYNSSNDWYTCNGIWYNYNSNDISWYTCNGIWYNRSGYNGWQNSYYCNWTWYNYTNSATWYYCNGTWYNRTNYNTDSSYYCNGVWNNYWSSSTWYFCNGTWYNRYDDNVSNSSWRSYYCNWSWLISEYSDRYYCNWNYYYFDSGSNYNGSSGYYNNGSSSSSSLNADIRVKNIKVDVANRRLNAEICNDWNIPVKTNAYVNFYSANTWRSRSKNVDIDLYSWACTDLYSHVSFEDLWIYSSWNYSISARLSTSSASSSSYDTIRNLWINY
ncbi:MAG: hypothetical protein ACD_3C00003G0003 [uncultured bacterium (gcode 4)]|uniref:Uncharacterized protein n=1 Tax=uncultured bacterium (gcode 4) TaxID=1234023 RepID=K2GEX9_9BACT|nr:MAG: hypothetical protein ACD_3C00003G0003 [uncultured bacterium (gcode 4)]